MIIKTENLKRLFQVGSETVEALKGINLSVNKGEFLSIMGPSGSGKTTLMNIIGCLDTPSSGVYYLNNKFVNKLDEDELAAIRNKEIGFVFQSFHLLAKNSALNNVMLPMKYAGISESEAISRAKNVLDKVGLSDRISHSPSELSGGQQQRVAVARAIVLKPKVLLFDEPLSNLDAKLRRQVREDIREIQQKLGVTTIYVTHDQEEALAISDKVIVMNKAVIAQQGSPKDLYNFPKNKFVANFIGDANDVSAEIINKQSDTYELKLAEMSVKIKSNQDLNGKVTLALRPEKIKIKRNNDNNCIHATIKNASFVGSSYQYILNSKIGNLYVVSGDTNDVFKVGEEVFLSINEKDIKILSD